MTRKVLVTAAVALVALCFSSTAYAETNLVVNPSFEDTSNYIDPWVWTSADWLMMAPAWDVPDGQVAVNVSAFVAQTIPTTPGSWYVITYQMAANPTCGDGEPRTMDVRWDGMIIDSPTRNTAGYSQTNMQWSPGHHTVSATSNATPLEFVARPRPDYTCGPTLDNVSVTARPEPTFVSVGVGCAGDVVRTDVVAHGPIGSGSTITLYRSSGGSPFVSTGQSFSFVITNVGAMNFRHDFDVSALPPATYKAISSGGVESGTINAPCGPGHEIPEASAALLLPLSVLGTFGIAAGVLYVRRRKGEAV